MALILDSALLDPHDRIDAVNAAMSTTEVPHLIAHGGTGAVRHRVEVWELGAGSHLVQLTGSAIRLERGPRQVKVAAPERVALGLQLDGPAARTHLGVQEPIPKGGLILTDQTSQYVYTNTDEGTNLAYIIDSEVLRLPVDVVRRAVPGLKQSPLYALVQSHIAQLAQLRLHLSPSPSAVMLGAATAELLRSLIITAGDASASRQREVLDDTLLPRIKEHIERHLRDPALSVQSIAGAHHVSVRHVYQVWSGQELTLAQWIIRARLEGARRELARAGGVDPIAVVAQRWGFPDAGHFSKRFNTAFDMSPRAWRQLSGSANSAKPGT